ncbi:MAG: 16S rRNA (guanine(527)-N(7))-methyltransferase RsmG [Hyphomicrobiales bacterium]
MILSQDAAAALAASLGVSRESWVRVEGFVGLLRQWQARINLVSHASLEDIWTRHVLDSLQLVPLLPAGLKAFADLGSGSGFPAIPTAIATGAHVHIYESNAKKAAFLREALRQSQAAGTVHVVRLESAFQDAAPAVQAVTARALAPLPLLIDWSAPLLAQGAHGFFHKGQDLDSELTQTAKYWRIKTKRHPSITDSQAAILEVEEVWRVEHSSGYTTGSGHR